MKLEFQVNGAPVAVDVPPMKRLLDVLREDVRLTGTKEGCGEGECGACCVTVDGELSTSCLVPAIQAQGSEVRTVEGIDTAGALDPLQKAFLTCNGAQCGICTPGMLVAARYFLDGEGRLPGEDAKEALAGNLCRCTGYEAIFRAMELVQAKPAKKPAAAKKKKSVAKKTVAIRRAVKPPVTTPRRAAKPASPRRAAKPASIRRAVKPPVTPRRAARPPAKRGRR